MTLITSREHDDPAGPVEGFYLHRRRGCVDMPVHCWFGAPLDPVTGEPLDRSPRWQLTLVDELVDDWDRIWPKCLALPIDEAEHTYLVARVLWARENDPNDPYGAVDGRIDINAAPMPFGD